MRRHHHTDDAGEAELEFLSELSGPTAATVVAAIGDFDLCNAADLKAKLLRALGRGPRLLVLDLERTTFMDSTIFQVLVAVHRRAGLLGITFCLANVSGSTAKCLTITGLDTFLSIHPTVDAAVQSATRAPLLHEESGVAAGDQRLVRP